MNRGSNLSQDEALLNNITQTVLSNLNNEQFGVEELAQQVGMSRSNLHRKLKLLQGKTTSQFIREVRLQEALKLLHQDVATSSEIAYQVGFNSTSYFHKCFQDYYGHPPSEIKNGNFGNFNANKTTRTPSTEGAKITSSPSHLAKNGLVLKWGLASSLVVAIILAAIAIWPTSQPNAPQKSVAILPLANISGDSAQDYMVAGLHDALIGKLGENPALRVISRNSVLTVPSRDMLVQEIAQTLNVDMIAEGSVGISGDSLLVRIQLVEPRPNERLLWSREYRKHIRDVLVLKNDIVRDITESAGGRIPSEVQTRLANNRTVSPETYRAYVRGMYFLRKSTVKDRKQGLQFLHQAVDHDPADPLAWARLALGYIAEGHSASSSDDAFKRAKAAAMQALKLDSTLLEARAALGRIQLYYEWDWEAAEKTFRYVNEVNPSMASNHYHYAWYLYLMGRKDEAIREHELDQDYDPLGAFNTAWLAWLYAYYGEYEKAENAVEKTFELDSTYSVGFLARGLILQKQGRNEESIAVFQKLASLYPWQKGLLGVAYARAGQTENAQKILAELESQPDTPWKAWEIAVLHNALGNTEEAIQWLHFEPHHAYVPWARVIPFNEPLRKDTAFHTLMAEMNLPPVTIPYEAGM